MEVAPCGRFEPFNKIFYWPFQGRTSFVDIICFVLCLLCLCARLFVCALKSPVGKMLTSWLASVLSNCEFVTFIWVSWVRYGTWLNRALIFAPLLTFMYFYYWKEIISTFALSDLNQRNNFYNCLIASTLRLKQSSYFTIFKRENVKTTITCVFFAIMSIYLLAKMI